MKKILITFFATIGFIAGNCCFAGAWSVGKIKIIEIRPWGKDALVLKWTGPNTECPTTSNLVEVIPAKVGGAEYFNRIYSGAVAAAYSQQPVAMYLNGCDSGFVQYLETIQFCGAEPCVF